MTVEERGKLLLDAGLPGGQSDAREAQWVALAAAAGGCFIRSQYESWAGVDRKASSRLVRRLSAAGLGGEEGGGAGIGRYVQLGSRRIYSALGMGDSRHRRKGSAGHLLQRLLALDVVVARGGEGWLFGGGEQAAAFRAAGAPDAVLPRRSYRAAGGDAERVAWFPAGWPIRVDGGDALFVFPDSGEAGQPQLELRTWGRHHARLWDWLRRNAVGVEAVFACRSEGREQAVRKELQRWVDSGVPPRGGGSGQDPSGELARINDALQAGRVKELEEQYGAITAALKRRTALAKSPSAQPRARVRAAGTWLSGRLQSRAMAAGPELDPADFEVIRLSGGAARA